MEETMSTFMGIYESTLFNLNPIMYTFRKCPLIFGAEYA